MMRGRVPPAMVPLIGLMWLAGCNKTKPPETIPPKILVPAAPVAPAQTSSTPRKPAKEESPKSSLPPNTDSRNVFLVSHVGEPMEIQSTNGALPDDHVTLAAADASIDSTQFVLDSVGKSDSPQFVGKGKADPKFTLPKGFAEVKAWGYTEDGVPMRIECKKTGSLLALVPSGNAIVGTDEGEADCRPSFKMQLDAYYMEVLEVTVESYERYRAELREKKKNAPAPALNSSADPKMPALGVVFPAAQSCARWAGMELPTESEFEKAARGPSGLRAPWGDGKTLWGERTLAKVGSYATDCSVYGIFDLAGNAKEWCVDHYSPQGHKEAALTAAEKDLRGWTGAKLVKDMNLRIVKGGGPDWNAWYREGRDVGKAHPDVGFRCVLRSK